MGKQVRKQGGKTRNKKVLTHKLKSSTFLQLTTKNLKYENDNMEKRSTPIKKIIFQSQCFYIGKEYTLKIAYSCDHYTILHRGKQDGKPNSPQT